MATITIRLDPRLPSNPELDIRYVLPDLIASRSGGAITDGGYGYVENTPYMVDAALVVVMDVLAQETILGNHLLPASVVALERAEGTVVVYPKDFTGSFPS